MTICTCGKPIEGRRSTRKFCSNACRQAEYRVRVPITPAQELAVAADISVRSLQKVKRIRQAIELGVFPEDLIPKLSASRLKHSREGGISLDRGYQVAVFCLARLALDVVSE
jgi:hypothetical protein